MPVFEQGYRRYVGERSTRNPALAIAWANVRTRLRWWLWVVLFFLLFFPYVVFAGIIFVATLGAGLTGSPPPAAIPTSGVAFESLSIGPGQFLGIMQGGSLKLFWDVLHASTFASVAVPAVMCSGLLASDRRTGALQIYFARPVTRRDYLVAKAAAATFFVALTTAIPALLLWGETVAFGATSTFTWRTWVAPFAILGASAFHALWSVSTVLFFSSLMRRPIVAAIATVASFLVLEGIGGILAQAMRSHGLGRGWHVIGPSFSIGTMTAPLFGVDIPKWINAPLAGGLAVGVPLVLLWIVWRRLKAVEVAT
jgi:hypothetical protein